MNLQGSSDSTERQQPELYPGLSCLLSSCTKCLQPSTSVQGAWVRCEQREKRRERNKIICRFILSCPRAEDFLAQLNLLCPELCCLTSPSLLKAGEGDLCFLFGDRHSF